MKSFLWKHLRIHIKIDEHYRKKAFQSSNKSEAPNQKMRIAGAALILVFLLSTTICKGEENRDQEAEEDPATENFYLWEMYYNAYFLVFFIACFVVICTIPCCIMCCFCRSKNRKFSHHSKYVLLLKIISANVLFLMQSWNKGAEF